MIEHRNVRDLFPEKHVNLPPFVFMRAIMIHKRAHVCNPHPAGLANFLVHPLNYIHIMYLHTFRTRDMGRPSWPDLDSSSLIISLLSHHIGPEALCVPRFPGMARQFVASHTLGTYHPWIRSWFVRFPWM